MDAGIGVVAAIGAVRREFRRVEGVLKDIGIFVAADPAQGIKLVSSADHVGKESGKFEGADVESNSNVAQLLLQHCDKEASALFGRSLHGEVKADSIHCTVASCIQKFSRAFRIVLVAGDIAVIGPALRGQYAISGLRKLPP